MYIGPEKSEKTLGDIRGATSLAVLRGDTLNVARFGVGAGESSVLFFVTGAPMGPAIVKDKFLSVPGAGGFRILFFRFVIWVWSVASIFAISVIFSAISELVVLMAAFASAISLYPVAMVSR